MFVLDGIDNDKKKNGFWSDYDGDSSFLIASTSSTAFQLRFSALQKPFSRKIEKNELKPEVSLNILCTALAECVLLDWKGCADSTGKDVPYTYEAALFALKNNDLLREFIQEQAMDISNFEKQIEEKEIKN